MANTQQMFGLTRRGLAPADTTAVFVISVVLIVFGAISFSSNDLSDTLLMIWVVGLVLSGALGVVFLQKTGNDQATYGAYMYRVHFLACGVMLVWCVTEGIYVANTKREDGGDNYARRMIRFLVVCVSLPTVCQCFGCFIGDANLALTGTVDYRVTKMISNRAKQSLLATKMMFYDRAASGKRAAINKLKEVYHLPDPPYT